MIYLISTTIDIKDMIPKTFGYGINPSDLKNIVTNYYETDDKILVDIEIDLQSRRINTIYRQDFNSEERETLYIIGIESYKNLNK